MVIPVYNQAQFLVEAATSALSQTLRETGVVIVNDGCPDPVSHQLGAAFAASYPDRVAYLRQTNGGLPAARNRGVRHALARWPGLEALFFLDADNLLEPHVLKAMYEQLGRAGNIGWVYGALEQFGTNHATWYGDSPANLFRMLFENQCDAGSLVRRKVFDDAIFFDETMRQGYEDWEFFLRVLRQGYRGERAENCGLLYRVKRQSMLVESKTKHDGLVADIQERHRDVLDPRSLTALEHEHCPRFLWISPAGDIFTRFTDPDAVASPMQPGDNQEGHWPPVLLIGASTVWQFLARSKIFRGILLLAQATAPACPVSFGIDVGDGTGWQIVEGRQGQPLHLLCLYSWHLQIRPGPANALDSIASTILRSSRQHLVQAPAEAADLAPEPLTSELVHRSLLRARAGGVFNPPAKVEASDHPQSPTRRFAWDRHCVKLNTTHPLIGSGKLCIGIAVPWLKLGGADHCVIQLSEAIRRLLPDVSLHLVTTQGGVECGIEKTRAFNEVIFLAPLDWEKQTRLCDVVFRSMDLVMNVHSLAAYESLTWRVQRPRQDRRGVHVSYLHVIDERGGKLVGYPILAAELEHAFDGFAVISENLRSFLINQGVSPGRIRVAHNAPVVRPASSYLACEMAAAKARRLAAGERPLRLLFAGRVDYQKGISRLCAMTELLAARGSPFQLTFVGDSVLQAEPVKWPTGYVRSCPATHDEAVLASYYANADVFVLLSRWEGVPLSLLDAMAHGCIAIATDVGAVSELIEHEKNGFLVPNASGEDVATVAANLIGQILEDKTGCADLRQRAVAEASRYSWDEAAKVLLGFLPEAVKARHGLSGV